MIEKRPGMPIAALAVVVSVCAVALACMFARSRAGDGDAPAPCVIDTCVSEAILAHNRGNYKAGEFQPESHINLKIVEGETTAVVYLMAYYSEYDFPDGSPGLVAGSHVPAALTFSRDEDGSWTLMEYWEAQDGSDFGPSIRAKFPPDTAEKAIDTQLYVKQQQAACDRKAAEYLRGRRSRKASQGCGFEKYSMFFSLPANRTGRNQENLDYRTTYIQEAGSGRTRIS